MGEKSHPMGSLGDGRTVIPRGSLADEDSIGAQRPWKDEG